MKRQFVGFQLLFFWGKALFKIVLKTLCQARYAAPPTVSPSLLELMGNVYSQRSLKILKSL